MGWFAEYTLVVREPSVQHKILTSKSEISCRIYWLIKLMWASILLTCLAGTADRRVGGWPLESVRS